MAVRGAVFIDSSIKSVDHPAEPHQIFINRIWPQASQYGGVRYIDWSC